MKNAAFDRLTGCESLDSSERADSVAKALAESTARYWPVTVTLDDGTTVAVEVEDAAFDARPWEVDRYVVFPADLPRAQYREARGKALEAAREALAEEQRALLAEQTDARAIDWLKKRERLVEQEDGRWVLTT